MYWNVAFVLAFLWILGVLTATTLGGVLHILLILALAAMLIGFFQDRDSSEERVQ